MYDASYYGVLIFFYYFCDYYKNNYYLCNNLKDDKNGKIKQPFCDRKLCRRALFL